MSLPEKDDYNHWRKKLLGRIAVCFGGRIAEELVFGDMSAGAQNDIEQATNLANLMVCELGMSDAVGPIKYTTDDQNGFLGREFHLASDLSEKTLDLINSEVRKVIENQYDIAKQLLLDNREELDTVAQALLQHETLTGDEIGAILRGDDLSEFQAAQERQQAELEREHKEREQRRKEKEREQAGDEKEPGEENPGIGLSGA